MSKTVDALSTLDFMDCFGITIPASAQFHLNFVQEEKSLPFSASITLRSLDHRYLIKALAKIKNVEITEDVYDDTVVYEIPAYGLTFKYNVN